MKKTRFSIRAEEKVKKEKEDKLCLSELAEAVIQAILKSDTKKLKDIRDRLDAIDAKSKK
jgi:hypothetical protein